MKSNQIRRNWLVVMVLMSVLACKKDSKNYSTTSTRDYAIAELNFADVFKVVDAVSKETEGIRSDFFECIESTDIDTISNPKTLQIHFGQTDCSDENGIVRSGTLSLNYSGRYLDQGTTVEVDFENYRVDGFLVSGTMTIVNLGINQNDLMAFSVQVDNGVIHSPTNSYSIEWETNEYREWVVGSDSPWLVDDEWRITGTSNGKDRSGTLFTTSIRSAIRTQFVCPWVVSGTVEIEEEGPLRLLDYGDGSCDADMMMIVNEQETELSL